MKCDELKRHHINEVMDMHNLTRGEMGYSVVYYADDVDAAIAELKQKLENVQASHYAEMVDAGMRERRLKRAFYKACANWAHIAVAFFSSYVNKNRWRWMELKCRAKAEGYK